MATLNFTIENMHCNSCVRRVMQTINALPDTHAEEVRVGAARVRTEADPKQVEEALSAAGYPARVLSE
ncbi:MAG TPA: heavy metal-associated domain-containing protein [Candidatus Aquilonibacter sp.]|nr:heavy metal-associated domain-containing protein [Candidatus Aquilonibacter sp.]